MSHAGAPVLVAGQAQPLAMTSADLDGDGIADLVIGYSTPAGGMISVQRGNLDAFAPQSTASFQAIAHGRFPSPFLPDAQIIKVPVTPDFLAVGNFTGTGHQDLVVAARGGNALYVLAGVGKGSFAAPQPIDLAGGITALAAGNLGSAQQFTSLIAGAIGPQNQSFVRVFAGTEQGLAALATYPLASPASALAFGDLDGDNLPDAAVLAGGQVSILHGSTMQMEAVSLPVSASAMALGSFIHDRDPRVQMALLTSDGTVHIAVHDSFDPRPFTADEIRVMRHAVVTGQPNPLAPAPTSLNESWKIVESFASAAPFVSSGATPVMFRTRVSSNAADDVMVLNSTAGQMAVISHPNLPDGATTFVPGAVSIRPYAGSPVAAVSARVNIDGRPGVIALHQGQVAPAVMMPLPDPTFTVNTTNDTVSAGACAAATVGQCSLREAIREANATAGVDTIMVPAGTYTLTIPNATATVGENAAATGDLDITDGVNIIGAGSATTIIQAGTTNANGIDKVLSINPNFDAAFDTSISGMTVRFGHNQTSFGTDGFGGGFDWEATGTGNLTVTDVVVNNSFTNDGDGGGITLTNMPGGTGKATFSGCVIQNNTAQESSTGGSGLGGGIFAGTHTSFTVSNTQMINNNAVQATGQGGAVFIFGPSGGGGQTQFHAVTISGNHAGSTGGGIHTGAGILIDQGSVISNNVAGTDGGGLWSSVTAETTTVSKSTITGNSATGSGGGIRVDNSTPNNFVMHFSRIAGNTAASGSALSNGTGTVNATNNWWGTNSPATVITAGSPAATFDPFIVLTHTASPATIRINQSTTLTGDMSKDNHGSGTALVGNVDVLNGLPITFNNAVDGSITTAQLALLNAGAQATAGFTAAGAPGGGKADATVDQATVTANIVVLAPLQITKSFNPTNVAVNASSTLTFSITNPNTIAVDASFTDTLPANLVVAATPGVTNTCGGTVTATAGSGSISFSNAALAVGSCTITVKVSSAVDSVYNNSVTINSTAAGTGAASTSTASLTVINPPTIAKAFGAATIPLNGTTSLTFTLSSTNANLALNGVAFTDNLPAGLIVASTPNLSNTCGGTAAAAGGSSSVSLSGATLAAAGSCTVSVDVQGTTPQIKNNSVQATSSNGGTGNTSNASITVIGPPVIIKAFGVASIPLNGSTRLIFTIQNNNTTVAQTGVAFSDTLPAGLVIATPNGLAGSCGAGTITDTAGTSVIRLVGGSIGASSSCSFAVNVTGTAAGTQNNTTGNVTSTEGGTGGTASASINVLAPPTIAKAFNPAAIALNATTSLTFTITNPAANALSLTGVAFTDTLPTGLTVGSASATLCGGTVTTTAPTGISLSGGTIAANSQCQFSVTVTGTTAGSYTNTTGNITSANGGTGNTASANLSVATPPTIAKSFGAAGIPLNGTTSLTFNITNPNTALNLTGLAFSDNLPVGLVVASTPGISNTCGGTVTAAAGASSVSLSAGTLASSASCSVSVTVQGTIVGIKNNSVQVSSTDSGTGNTSNASITVIGPPVIIKAFGAASIPLNGSTTLTFTIQNNNTTSTLTGIGFSDTLPTRGTATLIISTPNGLAGSCGGGTITATAGTQLISLSGATLAASSSCTFSVNITGNAAGDATNTTGNVTSTEGGTGGTASASITVVAPPSIAKAFNPASIALNATTSLTFTITNPAANAVSLTGVAFTDTLPTGLTVGSASATICGGTVTTTTPTGISLSGGTIAANSQCQFSVTVTGAAAGNYTNTTGNVTSTNGGTGNTASANLSVATPPTIAKSFGAAGIPLNGTTSLTFNITNPNTALNLTGLAFTDNLPVGLVVASTPGISNTCGGTVTAAAGASSVSLSAGTLASTASCSVSVTVQGTIAGIKNNSVQVSSTESGTGNTSNASITVIGPPVIIKAFGAASIPLNGSTTLTFTIQNNNTTSTLTGIGFSDTLPTGLVVSTPNSLTGTCGGGTITATAGSGSVSLSGASLAASSSCTFAINVTGTTSGTKNNTTGNVTSTEGGTGGTASASLSVEAPPSIAKAFNPTAIAVNGTSTLTLTITNPAVNAAALTGVAVTDNLPAGLIVATPNGLANTCGGTATATAGSGSISLTGGTVATNSNCTISVNVTSSAAGSYVNTTGAVSSTNGGTGNTATATLTVQPADLTITKTHAGVFTRGQTGAVWTITVNNAGAGPTTGTVTVVDTLPNVTSPPVPTAISGTGWTCTLGTLTCTRSDALAPGASYPAISLTVDIPGTIPNTFTNTATASGGGETNTGNDTATDTISLGPPIIITPHGPTSMTVTAGGSGTIDFDVTDSDPSQGFVGFTCAGLPIGAACDFTPGAITAGSSQMTMTISTSSRKGGLLTGWKFDSWRPTPLYALLFPLLGLVWIGFSAGKGRKLALRRLLALAGMAALLAFAGCGGRENPIATPPGNYQINVTAASLTAQANTTITLTVQ